MLGQNRNYLFTYRQIRAPLSLTYTDLVTGGGHYLSYHQMGYLTILYRWVRANSIIVIYSLTEACNFTYRFLPQRVLEELEKGEKEDTASRADEASEAKPRYSWWSWRRSNQDKRYLEHLYSILCHPYSVRCNTSQQVVSKTVD